MHKFILSPGIENVEIARVHAGNDGEPFAIERARFDRYAVHTETQNINMHM